MSKQSEAVKSYFEEHGLVQKDIAERMGISPASLNNMLKGRDNIGKRRAQKLHELFGFDIVYLLTGQGTLFGSGVNQRIEAPNNSGSIQQTNETSDVAALKTRIKSLEEENAWLRSMVDKMTSKT